MASHSGTHLSIPGDILIVVHEFVARSEDEITLRRGERIQLIERDDEFGDGWYLGKHVLSGKSGLFPEVYTTAADKLAAKSPTSGLGPTVNGEKHDSGFSARSVSSEENRKPQREDEAQAAQAANHQNSSNAFAQRKLATGSRSVSMGSISHQLSSPVMNETLSVIEEHITDMNTPRQSYLHANNYNSSDADTDVVSAPHRLSYINGNETDEEEITQFSETEVRAWTPAQVAEHLETLGADRSHCKVFQEQEISGDLLLDMDRGTILLKEFELGTIGRRLALFSKIQKFQADIKAQPPQSKTSSMSMTSTSESVRGRAVAGSANLPMISSFGETSNSEFETLNLGRQRAHTNSTHGPLTLDTGKGHISKPSASSIRSVPTNRRHSSIEYTSAPNTPKATTPGSPWHSKQRSVDAPWGSSTAQSAGILETSTNPSWLSPGLDLTSNPPIINSPEYRTLSANAVDLDRGYSSSNEHDSRKFRNMLRKRDSGSHARVPSESTATRRLSGVFKHIRSSSTEIVPKSDSPIASGREDSPTIESLNGQSSFGGSSPALDKATSPLFSKRSSKPKPTGLRAISDAITSNEKSQFGKHSAVSSLSMDLRSPISLDSSNQSITSTGKSVSFEERTGSKAESPAKLAALPLHPSASRRKAKRETSAYRQGLEKKTPAEQIAGADYSGWMKKKSKKLGKWHPRLFVLRGRRLSYYYSEDDTEEKGLIDISFHRVLPANKDLITGFHAFARAGSGPVSPEGSTLQTAANIDTEKSIKDGSENSGIFIFKLVPPRPGLSKAVNFTQPKVHFFAAASLQEGRNWMAALMKATIERDELKPITSTYKEKTMSLHRAKELRVRPPELATEEGASENAGLGITKEGDTTHQDGDNDAIRDDGWNPANASTSKARPS